MRPGGPSGAPTAQKFGCEVHWDLARFIACAGRHLRSTYQHLRSNSPNPYFALPQPMKITVRHCLQGAGFGQSDSSLEYWLRQHFRPVRRKFRPCELNRQLRSFCRVVKRNPCNMMLDRIRVRDLLAHRNLHLQRFPRHKRPLHRYHRYMLLRLPIRRLHQRANFHLNLQLDLCVNQRLSSSKNYSRNLGEQLTENNTTYYTHRNYTPPNSNIHWYGLCQYALPIH